ncbi:MAG TPA: PQQ-dependent sugar dehydrogenase [Aggregatilineales bacterium]|nr:PQQ-dependent sugar dehydrogenase [Aggregatilineales bacterium]
MHNGFRFTALLCFCAILLSLGAAHSGAAPFSQGGGAALIVPPGFRDVQVVGGLYNPRDFTFLPDGRILILERGKATSADARFGSIRVFKNGQLLPQYAWDQEICHGGEQGLLGITPDPNFATNNYVYVFYTAYVNVAVSNDCTGRISRLTMSGDVVVANSEKIVLQNILSPTNSIHNAGDLRFGPDGYLYLTTGNAGINDLGQFTNTLSGKVIRIRPDTSTRGYSTVGNPFHSAANARYCGEVPDGPGPCREIWAYGFRNPFRMSVQPSMSGIPGTGNIWLGDVGGGSMEEVNRILPGLDYGHPTCEGDCNPPDPNRTNPVYAYPHPPNIGAAIIVGDFYVGSPNPAIEYPSQYLNNYFFADFVSAWVRRLAYVNGSWEVQAPDFATRADPSTTIIGMITGPNGNLYYLNYSSLERSSDIRMIEYGNSSNLRPIARVSAPNLNCAVNTQCSFDASASSDPNGDAIAEYRWRIRYAGSTTDVLNTTTTSPTLNYAFLQAVNATVTLTVVDNQLPALESTPVSITVYPGNQLATGVIDLNNLTEPGRTPSLTYHAGDRWSFAPITLNDPDGWGTTAPDSAITWSVVFHHNDHTHSFLPLITTRTGQFTIPTTYHEDYRLWYRVILFITDARGQVTRIEADVDPVVVNVNFNTVPFAVPITVDGLTFNPPNTTQFIVGTRFVLNTSASVTREGITYNFVNWSDSPTRTRTVTIPASNTTFTANFGNSTTSAPIRNRFTSTDTNLVLNWLPVSGATGYEVQISTSSTFSSLVTVPGNPYPGTTLTMPMVPPGIYYWRVRALRAAPAAPSAWSTPEAFSVASP